MNPYPLDVLNSTPWQATSAGVSVNLRNALMLIEGAGEIGHKQTPKKLTTEAVCMISLLLAFVILTMIGSSIDEEEYFRNSPTKKDKSGDLQKETTANNVPHSKDKEKLSIFSVWKKKCQPFIICFNIRWNLHGLFAPCDELHLHCLDGIRTIGFIIVVVGHIFGIYVNVLRNTDINLTGNLNYIHILPKGMMVVEGFFTLSGILNGYLVSNLYHKNKGKISWKAFPLRRLTRLTPIYLLVLAFYAILFPYLGSGSLWPKYATNPVCKKYWIWNLVYFNNLLPAKKQCMTPYWYLACLMQLHIISPLFLIPLLRKPKLGFTLTALVIVMSILVRAFLIIHYDLLPLFAAITKTNPDILAVMQQMWRYFDGVHINVFTRFCSYATGIVLGCYIYSRRLVKTKKTSLVLLSFGWIICVILLYLSAASGLGILTSVYHVAVFYSLKPLYLICGLSWIIFVCVTDQGGFVNKFLSCRFFAILSRLSESGYLIHMMVLEKYFLSFQETKDHSHLYFMFTAAYVLLWLIAISFIFTWILAMPVSRIYDLCHEILHKKSHQKMN